MCPVRRSLKNQRTAPAQPIADMLRGIGIGVGMVGTAWTGKRLLLARAQRATAVTTLAGRGRRHVLHGDASELRLIGDVLFSLQERPIVPVLPCVSLRCLALSETRPDTRQVFQTDARPAALGQCHHVFREAVMDMRDAPSFMAL